MTKWVKYAAIAAGVYVGWRLLNGAKISELLSLQNKNSGSEGKAGTFDVGGKNITKANAETGGATGMAFGGDGSTTADSLNNFWQKDPSRTPGPLAPGNPLLSHDWAMS